MTYLKINKLIKHRQEVHQIAETYNCDYCDYVGPSPLAIFRHVQKTHRSNQIFITYLRTNPILDRQICTHFS